MILLEGCSIEFPRSDKLSIGHNAITSGNALDNRAYVRYRSAQFCYSEVPIPLSEMRRQPAATADSAFVLGDNTMQCPSGSEPVHNIEDCLTYVAGSQTFTNDVSDRYYSASSGQMGACIDPNVIRLYTTPTITSRADTPTCRRG